MKTRVAIVLLSLVMTACGNQAVVKMNVEGNEAFTEGDFVAAVDAYRNAQLEEPDLPELYYNAGNAYYRQDDYENAALQAHQALHNAHNADETVAQSTFYNLGNIQFNTQQYDIAIESYKEALRINPDDVDAKHNLELALRQLQLEQEAQQQDQQQQDQQQQDQQQQQQQQQDQQQQQQDQQQQQQQDQQQQQQQQQSQSQADPQQSQQSQAQDEPQDVEPQEGEMTEEEAERLFDAIAEESQTLQEYLHRIFVSPDPVPQQDW